LEAAGYGCAPREVYAGAKAKVEEIGEDQWAHGETTDGKAYPFAAGIVPMMQ
jgi:hypothetical protein